MQRYEIVFTDDMTDQERGAVCTWFDKNYFEPSVEYVSGQMVRMAGHLWTARDEQFFDVTYKREIRDGTAIGQLLSRCKITLSG